MSEHHNEPLRTWKLTPEEVEDEELSKSFSVDSSAAWYQFEDFFASRGYDLRYDGSPIGSRDDERCMPRRPKVNFDKGLGNPFKPCREKNLPYVFHDPSKYPQAYERMGASGIWSLRVSPILSFSQPF
ncbi:MAG TPA: hypothetical protein VGO47_02140 [Chlamydiales bacterium]|nr:hypothetical protein [Chlamydiales bacterium]